MVTHGNSEEAYCHSATKHANIYTVLAGWKDSILIPLLKKRDTTVYFQTGELSLCYPQPEKVQANIVSYREVKSLLHQ